MDKYDENAAAIISIIRNAGDPARREIHLETLNIIGHLCGDYTSAERSSVLSAIIGQTRKLLQ